MFANLYDTPAADPMVHAVVDKIKALPGANALSFEFQDGETEYGFPFHQVRITSSLNGKHLDVPTGPMLLWPQILINELYIYGMMQRP